ncbi:MAG: preprotein translocase subunit YajC [Spirochaetales bacterium]|nr:preprotein translocase subunit YajC [Spirochaetales bacterium]
MSVFTGSLPIMQVGASGGSMTTTIIMFAAVIAIFYFFIIRPQNKKQKETKNMLAALKKGDKVQSIGGIRGVVQNVSDTTVVVKVDDNTKMEFSKSAISEVLEVSPESKKVEKAEKSDETKKADEAKKE